METTIEKKPVWINRIRWAARILSVLFAIFLLVSLIFEDMSTFLRKPQDYFILILWILTSIGYLIGLWREGLGGLISFVSALTLIIIFIVREGQSSQFYQYLILFLLLVPGILYLLYLYFKRKSGESIS
jgi:hypothetical protein